MQAKLISSAFVSNNSAVTSTVHQNTSFKADENHHSFRVYDVNLLK